MMSFGQVLLSYVERKRSASANLELYNSSLEHIKCTNFVVTEIQLKDDLLVAVLKFSQNKFFLSFWCNSPTLQDQFLFLTPNI